MISRLATAALAALLLLICSATPTHSQALDPASADALATTLRMLADPAARGRIIATDPTAAGVARQVPGMACAATLGREGQGAAAGVVAALGRSTRGPRRATRR